jgi:hypothetical protein
LKNRLVRWRLNSKCEGLHQLHALSVTVPSNPSWTRSTTLSAMQNLSTIIEWNTKEAVGKIILRTDQDDEDSRSVLVETPYS